MNTDNKRIEEAMKAYEEARQKVDNANNNRIAEEIKERKWGRS